jgi:hypothetical protein
MHVQALQTEKEGVQFTFTYFKGFIMILDIAQAFAWSVFTVPSSFNQSFK